MAEGKKTLLFYYDTELKNYKCKSTATMLLTFRTNNYKFNKIV